MSFSDERRSIERAANRLKALRGVGESELPRLHGLKDQVVEWIQLVRSAMYPHIFTGERYKADLVEMQIVEYLQRAALLMHDMLRMVLTGSERDAGEVVTAFFDALPDIAETLETDVQAAYDGDPAARSSEEIMLAYPAFEAISIYRLAHCLYALQVPLLPRMMTEYAHRNTGIDIHPGATIGRYFFIDHGTGVVIGETCVIGEHVKLYQGVTLGAKSFEVDENGNPIKGIKRHPNIGDHVVIYAGATILGGQTHIGENTVIGGNVWLTGSVPAGQTVYNNIQPPACAECACTRREK